MKNKQISTIVYVAVILIAIIFTVSVFRNKEQTAEVEPMPEADVQMTVPPEPTPVEKETLVQEPTEEAADEAEESVEPTPTAIPVIELPQMEEFVSDTENFRVMVPAGWSSEETFPGAAFVMANSEAALERFKNDSTIESGDLILNIGFLPYELFRQREVVPLDIQFEATPDIFLQSLLPMFRIADNAVVSDSELVSLSDERDAGLLAVADEEREGMILMFAAGDEVVAFVSIFGFPGELDAFQETAYAVAAEVAFSGEQEVLFGALLGG